VSVNFTANHAPVANLAAYSRPNNMPLKIPISDLLANYTSDPDGDATALIGVSPLSANGAAVTTNATQIIYVPALPDINQLDYFNYAIRDVRSAYRPGDTVRTALGLVQVNVLGASTGPGFNQISIQLVDGKPTLLFAGIPSYTYVVQRTPSLTSPAWATIGQPVVAAANGLVQFQDTSPLAGQAYYRTAHQ